MNRIIKFAVAIIVLWSIVSCGNNSNTDADNSTEEKSSKNTVNETVNETGTFTDARDGKTYKWVKIGVQTWMAENLNYTEDDGNMRNILDNKEWANNTELFNGWCYYDNNPENGENYGALYQWEAAKNACPDGWHLPTNDELGQLISYLVENGYTFDGIKENEGIAKSLASADGWDKSEYADSDDEYGMVGSSNFPEFQNKTGFSALPGGSRSGVDGKFDSKGHTGYWFTATSKKNRAYGYKLYNDDAEVSDFFDQKKGGYSVRCVKNK
ncbi:MAG: FISUMP domain-containing protein [Bacteroidota bacterium]